MNGTHERLLDIAGRVSDGSRIDWEQALRVASSDDERSSLERLRQIAGLAEVHRGDVDATVTSPPSGAAALSSGPSHARWGRLELLETIGRGAFGDVWLAWDPKLERRVALKLLRPRSDGRANDALLREGRLLAKVSHPNLVTVHGAEEHDGRAGIWMELVRGRTLEDLLREQGPMSDHEAGMIGVELCRALAVLHGSGLVHRDVKAQNVMRAEGGRIVLMDLGAGRDLERPGDEPVGSLSGTPLYMAPELLAGAPATPRSDVYGVGVLLYHLVTGTFPVRAATVRELLDRHASGEARLLRDERPGLPEPFVHAVERALARNPADRFATAGQMEQALASCLGGEPAVRSRPAIPARAVHVAAAVAAVTLFAWISWPERPPRDTHRDFPSPAAQLPPNADISAPAVGSKIAATAEIPPQAPPGPSYSVEAVLRRTSASGRIESVGPGTRLSVGDELSLRFIASRSVWLYVVDEDEAGHAYALFPLPELALENPLAGGVAHDVPGTLGGKKVSWKVDTAGGREHILLVASPARLVEFEAEMNALPRAGGGAPIPLSDAARVRLRGIGAIAERTEPAPAGAAGRLFDLAERLSARAETVSGVWIREIEMENPAR